MNFYQELDKLLVAHNIDGAHDFLKKSLNDALIAHDTASVIAILNELIGFLRDITKNEESSMYAKRLKALVDNNNLDEKSLFISYINIANAYRANLELDEAIIVFMEALDIYNINNIDDKVSLAALYNNLGLAYQGLLKYEESIKYLLCALDIVKDTNNDIKVATTYVNISSSYIALNDTNNAFKYLMMASEIFKNHKNDFHYQGFLSAMGKYYNLIKDYDNAIKYYEEALANIAMHSGKNKFYNDTLEELFNIYKIKKINPHISGIVLSKSYYNFTKNDFFKEIMDLKEYITIGLFGLGSECFYASDIISEDHDFDPGYIVLVNDNVSLDNFNRIKESYDKLEKRFKRYYVYNLDKKGVHYFSKYINDFIDGDYRDALITNGKIFYEGLQNNLVTIRRDTIKNNRYSFIPKLILKSLEISQYIPYNLVRAQQRNDKDTYDILKNHLIDRLVEYYYILNMMFIPHDKLLFKLMNKECKIYEFISKIKNDDLSIADDLSMYLINNLHKYNIITKIDSIYIDEYRFYLLDYVKNYKAKLQLISKIVGLEWDSFKVLDNIGGKASCQLNKRYFYLMREAQFHTWNYELLDSYYNDLLSAQKYNYNLLFIKYGFMEESIDPKHYILIKDRLPILSEKQRALIDNVVDVSLEQKQNANIDNMRDTYASSDNELNASYETYLRGELSSYSERTLYLFARNLSQIINGDINYVKLTYEYTKMLHTDESL